MFAAAYSQVTKFTRPVISLIRLDNGVVSTGLGTYVVLNKDGWVLTAAHILQPLVKANTDAAERAAFEKSRLAIEEDSSLAPGVKRKKLRELKANPEWLTRVSMVFTTGAAQPRGEMHLDETADIGVVQLDDIQTLAVTEFPKFPQPGSDITPGTSLCTLGFPFQTIAANYNEQTKTFSLGQNNAPMAFFPTVGIHTRNAIAMDGARQIKFVETSSPGLKGQSGGPIFDMKGMIWAIQSRTTAYPLDIAPVAREGNKEVKEHQFIQIGLGCHSSHISQFLTERKIHFDVA